MLPKKAIDLIAPWAEKSGIPSQDMADIVLSYWKRLRVALVDMEYIRIYVPGLGKFIVRYGRIVEALHGEHKHILKEEKKKRGKLDVDDPGGTSKHLEKLKELKRLWDEEYKYEEKIKEVKRKYKETGIKEVKPTDNELKRKAIKGLGKKKRNR